MPLTLDQVRAAVQQMYDDYSQQIERQKAANAPTDFNLHKWKALALNELNRLSRPLTDEEITQTLQAYAFLDPTTQGGSR